MTDPRTEHSLTRAVMSRPHRSAVINGIVQYLSPSAIQTASDCMRRWHYRYVARKPEPQSASQALGTETHALIETYLKGGGRDAITPVVMAAARFIPRPRPEFLIEHPIDGAISVGGAPVIGYIDLVNPTGESIDSDAHVCSDPDGTVELVDWKTTSNLKYAKSGAEVASTIQMVTYGAWAVRALGARHARLSHVYMQTKGSAVAKKSTKRITADEVETRYAEVEKIALKIIDSARIPVAQSDDVPANTDACDNFGGCPHRSYCTAGKNAGIIAMFGKDYTEENTEMNPDDIANRVNALLSAETPTADPRFVSACEILVSLGRGFPTMTGAAAVQRGLMTGVSGDPIPGHGLLAAITLSTVDQVIDASKSVALKVASTPPVAILPPDAPASNPALAADRTPEVVAALSMMGALEPTVNAPTIAVAPVVTAPVEVAPEAPKKRGPGRPPKNRTDAPPAAPATTTVATSTASAPLVVESTGGRLDVFVDAVPNVPFESLDRYVDDICNNIASFHQVSDIRMGSGDSPLAYGAWKGVLTIAVRTNPPTPGVYVLFARDERSQIVADALRGSCDLFVRGVRG